MNTTALSTIKKAGLDMQAIDRADLQPTTKAQYKKAINNMLGAGVNPMDYNALVSYADGLKQSSRSFLKSALRMMSLDFEQSMKGSATPENIGTMQAGIMRLEAMRSAVKVSQPKGTKAHTWLTQKQVKDITALCGNDIEGKRDWIILGLLLGAGLRREELSALTFDAIKAQPMKGGKVRGVLQVKGKGAKDRVIPLSEVLANHLHAWQEITGGGNIARAMGMKKELSGTMSAVAIFNLVIKYGKKIGIEGLAPHDLRRTYAQLGYEAGIPITQISTLLGHSSVKTTQGYLNLALDLETTASDFIPLSGD